jgi:SAM-dependent methyltransferase
MTETTAILPTTKPGKARRRFFRIALVLLGAPIGFLIVLYFGTGFAENGTFGATAQAWVRVQKSSFTFNRLYSMANPPFDQTPNAFLVRSVENLQPGTALDIAAGQGRNSVYLAVKGWRVTAFDISEKGLEVAQQDARRAGVPLTTVHASMHGFDYGDSRWDLVTVIYSPLQYDDAQLLTRIRDSIKPGGLLLIDAPIAMHQPKDRRPRVPGDLERGELPSFFPDFEVLQYTESEDTTDFFRLKMPVGHFLAKKR